MSSLIPVGGLLVLVAVVLTVSRWAPSRRIFRWLPVPLWCYLLPLLAVTIGWLPSGHPAYRSLTQQLLPFALALLLLGVDVPAIMRTGGRALLAAIIGAVGIALGVVCWSWILRAHLPPDAWKGAGTLAATWTGGSLNLLALRALLDTPESIFAPLIIVDALIAYSWMALLVAASGFQAPMNRWLRAERGVLDTADVPSIEKPRTSGWTSLAGCGVLALALALGARWAGTHLPTMQLVSSATGWTVLVVTTGALVLSMIPPARRLGERGDVLGYPLLYLVLAATGAQANLEALRSAPVWIAVGMGTVVIHGGLLLMAGRWLRIPLGVLATASQANLGGFVSGPLVGAIYHRTLAPVGLLLAMAGSAFGTYCGLLAATLTRLLLAST